MFNNVPGSLGKTFDKICQICCDIVNVSKRNLDVTIEVFTYSGVLLDIPSNVTLSPGEGRPKCLSDPSAAYCKFNVKTVNRQVRARKGMVRAAAVYMNGNLYVYSIPAQ